MTEAARSGERVRAHWQRLRPIQIWVPEVRAPAVKAEAERQAWSVCVATHADQAMDFT